MFHFLHNSHERKQRAMHRNNLDDHSQSISCASQINKVPVQRRAFEMHKLVQMQLPRNSSPKGFIFYFFHKTDNFCRARTGSQHLKKYFSVFLSVALIIRIGKTHLCKILACHLMVEINTDLFKPQVSQFIILPNINWWPPRNLCAKFS